ncbi:MAG: exosortase H-associated membrane protein [Pseudomonadota bacterium]
MNDIRFSLKAFMLNVVLWLPLMFFLWFYVSGLLIMPVQFGLDALLNLLYGDHFESVRRTAHLFEVGAIVTLPEGRAVAEIPVNPMIYGYGLPLVAGLVIATPVAAGLRALQLLGTYLGVVLVQLWGSFWETFRVLAFELAEPGQAIVDAAGFPDEVIALCYQFGYLVLPAVVPVALWVLMNRTFIEGVVGHRIEPTPVDHGQ